MLRVCAVAAVCMAATPALAASSINVNITAHVDVFCQIYPPSDGEIKVVNGAAFIGNVREICNSPTGYQVQASFSNLSSGELAVAGNDYAIDNTGIATRAATGPAAQTLSWQLAQTQVTSPMQPVLMRVTISPR